MEQIPNNLQASASVAYDQNEYYASTHNAQIGGGEWGVNATFGTTSFVNNALPALPYSFSDSQSDSDGATRWN